MSETVTLYHGDNGAQDFYEDESSHWIVFRFPTRPDLKWQAFNQQRISETGVCGDTAEHAIRRLYERTGVRFVVDASKEWSEPRDSALRMRLTDLD